MKKYIICVLVDRMIAGLLVILTAVLISHSSVTYAQKCKPWMETANILQQAEYHLFMNALSVSLAEKARIGVVVGTMPWTEYVEVFEIGIPLQVQIGKGQPSAKKSNILTGFLTTLRSVPRCK